MEFKIKNNKNPKGFSLVEGMVAIFIVGFVMVGFMAVMGKTFKRTTYERDYIVASNLAQEGIEVVRNIRDNNLKNGDDAFAGFPSGNYDVSDHSSSARIDDNIFETSGLQRRVNISGSDDSRTITSIVTNARGINIEVEDNLWAWGDAE